MLLVAAAVGAAALAPWSRPSRAFVRDPLRLGVVLFVLSAVLSTALSRAPWVSLQGTNESFFGLLTVLAYVALFFATRALCASAADARRLMLAPVVAAGVASAYAVAQLGGVDPIMYGRTAGLGGFVRPFATMGHPNFLSAFLVMALPLVVLALVRAVRARQRLVAIALTLVAGLGAAVIAVAVSRGAWLALGAAAVVFVAGALGGGERRAAVLTAVAGAAGFVVLALVVLAVPAGRLVLNGVLARVGHLADSASRQHIWLAAWNLFRDHPIVGTGLDTFQIAFADKRTAAYWALEWNATPTRAHNEALNLLATQGALGGLAVLVFAVGLALAVRRALRATEDRLLVVALAAGVTAFAVQDLFSFTVAGCGTLAVVQAAVLSRLAEGGGAPDDGDGVEWLAGALGAGALAVVAIFAHNLVIDLLLDEPARLVGVLGALVALLAGGVAVFALEQRDRPPAFAAGGRAGSSARGALRLGLRWALGLGLVLLLVARPLAASRAAHAGAQRTLDEPALAIEPLELAVALEPYVEVYWVRLGTAAHAAARATRDPGERRRWLEQSRTAYERALTLVRANAYNHANLGRALADLARDGVATPGEVFARFDRALELDPNNAYFYPDATNASLLLGDFERARAYASRGVALYPRFALPRAQLGHIELARRRVPEAAQLLQDAVDGEWHGAPGRAGAAANLAAAWLQLDRLASAEQAARLAVTLAPGAPEARFNLGKALERLGRREEAIAEYRRLADFEPARTALQRMGAR
jgi:O-antigen ligase/tetratricopeptide (TPR) repeat protein